MATEYMQFVGAMVFLLGILIGSYWFVYAPIRRERDEDERRG
ncbi:MAG: hypothetical protein ACRDSJ_03615 [Rubrobacteraceae bacterium]